MSSWLEMRIRTFLDVRSGSVKRVASGVDEDSSCVQFVRRVLRELPMVLGQKPAG